MELIYFDDNEQQRHYIYTLEKQVVELLLLTKGSEVLIKKRMTHAQVSGTKHTKSKPHGFVREEIYFMQQISKNIC